MKRTAALIALGLIASTGLCWASAAIQVRLIDFEHYLLAAGMLWRGQSPYGTVEFFAPPWLAFGLAPFLLAPPRLAAWLWLLTAVLAVAAAALLALQWFRGWGEEPVPPQRLLAVLALALMPAALFSYVTGQFSPLVGLAGLVWSQQIGQRRIRLALLAAAMLIATAKPHLMALLLLLGVLELIRQRDWKSGLGLTAALAGAGVLSLWFDRDWPAHLLAAWLAADYRGGQPGLVAPGYRGLAELGIPTWVFGLHALYVLGKWRQLGLTPFTTSLALSVGLLLAPYSRSYDHVLLVLPVLYLTTTAARGAWVTKGSAVLSAWILPLTGAAMLAPVVVTLGLLAAHPARQPVVDRPDPPEAARHKQSATTAL